MHHLAVEIAVFPVLKERHSGRRQEVEDLLHRQQVTPPKGRTTYIIKDVRLFLNSVDRGLHLMRQAGVNADWGRQDTDEEILLTIRIPKRVRT